MLEGGFKPKTFSTIILSFNLCEGIFFVWGGGGRIFCTPFTKPPNKILKRDSFVFFLLDEVLPTTASWCFFFAVFFVVLMHSSLEGSAILSTVKAFKVASHLGILFKEKPMDLYVP